MRKPKKFAVVLLLIFCFLLLVHYCLVYRSKAIRSGTLKAMAITLSTYANEYDGKMPPADRWSDVLIQEEMCTEQMFDGKITYALNKNIVDKKYAELPNDVVVLFEVCNNSFSKNLTGGSELIKNSDYPNSFCAVQIGYQVDNIKIINKKNINELKWSDD